MSNLSTPSHGPSPAGEDTAPAPPTVSTWSSLIRHLVQLYGEAANAPVIDRLSPGEEAEIDRHLAAGLDIDEVCMEGLLGKISPLFHAAYQSCPPLVNALLARGARISMIISSPDTDSDSSPPTRESALGWCMLTYYDQDPRAIAIMSTLLATPEVLSPEEVNAPLYSLQRSPLSLCVQKRNKWVRDLLMDKGADPTRCDARGQTLLHQLATAGYQSAEMIKEDRAWMYWILDHGVPIDAIDINGDTALDVARKCRPDDGFVPLFESVVAELQSSQLDQQTPLVSVADRTRSRRI